jgi:hypothetical protein
MALNVHMLLGHVMEWMTVLMVLTKLIANLKVVQMVNLTVVTAIASMVHGHVMAMVTVLMVQTKLIVLLHHVKIKV